ncbi:MAG: DUF362 domain-containing protein [Lentisphaerae bacterium]|nr:DUF362 domain-containing protein [Lentisphaerota bacterium]MBT4822120.1 DUF362 domain-containing protein [Lentisphaerota bacterium]MBT5605888.1 DUF362 domain-containing protein [Lentisphaerota bacterium]MBT7057967.1 DUF362 domain-containing protein [Lentisphaerota bacterium]MBT7848522.1 DUF362 domain-containing protein [Lentisphaerota bacterium]
MNCPAYEPETVEQALLEALTPFGGIASFVREGQTVLLKPNLLSPRPPEQAVTTHPTVVAAVAKLCFAAGASRVWVGDSCAGDHSEKRLWEKTGMTAAVPAAGAELKSFTEAVKPLPVGDLTVPVPSWLEEVDVVISLPKLKTHILTVLTCALKNTYGLVVGHAKAVYHGHFPSPREISHFLVDLHQALPPALNIVDAVTVMEGDGPANGTPAHAGLLLAARDPVAIDAVASRIFGVSPAAVPLIRRAEEVGLGAADLADITVVGSGKERAATCRFRHSRALFLQKLPPSLFKLTTYLLTYRPKINQTTCVRCGVCAETCSQDAIIQRPDGTYRVEKARCILCMCCLEACPHEAVDVNSPARWLRRRRRKRREDKAV